MTLVKNKATKRSIVTAAREGNTNAVARLLQAGADFTARDGWLCSYARRYDGLPHTLPQFDGADIRPGGFYGDPALKAAVDGGHLEVLRQLLDAEKDITSVPGFYSDIALKTAVETSNHEEVVRLQKAAKTLERAARNKQSALFSATIVGNLQTMLSLISAGAEVEDPLFAINQCSLLAIASGAGHLDIVEFLLRTVENGGRGDAICAAAGAGHQDIFERLVQDMVEVDNATLTDALGSAVFNGDTSIIRRLLDFGASGNAIYHERRTDIQFDAEYKGWCDEWTALQLAALRDDFDLAETLLSAGADVNARIKAEYDGATALQVAAEYGSVALVQLLLAAGANVNAPPSDGGCTALQSACKGGRDETVRVLLTAGAIPKTDSTIPRDNDRDEFTKIKSGLEHAAIGGHGAVVQTLLESLDESLTNTIRLEALVEAIHANHMTIVKRLLATNVLFSNDARTTRLLPGAAKAGNLDVVRMLFEAPTNGTECTDTYDSRLRYSDSALLVTVKHEKLEIAKLLLAAGLDINVDNGRAGPVLHMAAEKGNLSITQLLLDSDADLTALFYTGTTALQAAERSGDAEIVKLLKSRLPRHGMVVNRADKTHKVLQQQQGGGSLLCPECSQLSLEDLMGGKTECWHTSLASLQSCVQIGCPFCIFVWRQLGIQNIDILQPSKVYLHRFSTYTDNCKDYILIRSQEPHPDRFELEPIKHISTCFHIVTSPFNSEYPLPALHYNRFLIAAAGKRRPITGDTASPETFQQIRSWLKRCVRGHRKCQADGKDAFLPTRLINISQISGQTHIKLVETCTVESHENTRYIALSHCWGETMEESATLTQATLECRLNSIPTASLPLTFLHLIQVAERLGINMFGIDSLCINQDSADDWNRESASMSSVYSHACCAVAASASKNTAEGLFRNAGLSSHDHLVRFRCSSKDGKSRAVIAMKEQDPSWENIYYSGLLHQRGWVLQERELSPSKHQRAGLTASQSPPRSTSMSFRRVCWIQFSLGASRAFSTHGTTSSPTTLGAV